MNIAKIDYNSIINQKIKREFVSREVYSCMSGLVEECLEKGIFQYEDIDNFYMPQCPQCGCNPATFTEENNDENEPQWRCNFCDNVSIDEPETEPQEIFEWWNVSDWLAEKLRAKGEPILSYDEFNYFWGRTCSGQAILLDNVISEICEEMGILEGQKNEWKV